VKLVFVRHGETRSNAEGRLQGHNDTELSAAGRAQVEKLARRFQDEAFRPTHLYSSPLRRASQTAEILARAWVVETVLWDDLMEYDVGIVSGMTWDEIADTHPEIDRELEQSRQSAGIRGAEPLAQRRARAQRVVDALISRHAPGDVVLVATHGGILQHILAALMGADRTWGMSVPNTAVFEFSIDLARWATGGEVKLSASFWRINRFNDATHLDPAQ
jgi:broad specificity phosphatase PhoE